ncbi:MAG TPA: serine/threonine-protein kinase [Gemmataceae bacterium]
MGIFDLFKGKPKKGKGKDAGPPRPKPKLKVDLKKRFDLHSRTGQGSMSKVWRAYDRDLGMAICLKLLDKEKTKKFEARFIGRNKPTEGEICMVLQHPNIVRTFDFGYLNTGEPFLSMEWVEGVGLNFLVETRSPGLKPKIIDYLTQLSLAVEYMHAQKYLHRDLCPRNVMITNEGKVKLIDFGLTIPYTPAFCWPGNRTGTPDYLAPEIIRRQSTDHRVDLFALGATAYELFTGGLPWPKAQGSMEILLKHINTPGRDPREFKPKMGDELHAFLVKGVEREPAKRFQSATEFRQELQALDEGALGI